jgi:hypothetical protein
MKRLLALFLLSLSLFAADRPPVVTQRKLDALVTYWRHVLQLDDWKVRARVVKLEDLPDGAAGASRADSSYRECRIYVMDPQDYEALAQREGSVPIRGKAILADIEDTVVHELIHLRLRQLMDADSLHLHSSEEATVVRLTDALLSVRKHK